MFAKYTSVTLPDLYMPYFLLTIMRTKKFKIPHGFKMDEVFLRKDTILITMEKVKTKNGKRRTKK